MNPVKPIIVPAGEGTELRAFGDVLSVLLGGEQTGGMLAVMFDVTPPGGGPPLHVHSKEDELFLVVEGRFRMELRVRLLDYEDEQDLYSLLKRYCHCPPPSSPSRDSAKARV